MDTRISMVAAAATLAVVPLLGGCGSASAPAGSSAAPASQAAAPSSSAPATPEASATTPAATPSSDPTADKKDVQAATDKFVKAVLTIGYPDKSFGTYTDRIKPLMTKDGFKSLETADSIKKGSATLTSLYAQRARSAPKLDDDTVLSLEDGRASVKVDYENRAQQKQGGDWKTLKTLGKGTVTVKLVQDGGKWLVEDAG